MSSDSTVTSHVRISSPGGVWRLLFVFGPDADRTGSAKVLSEDLVLGRSPEGEGGLAIADKELSRQHVRLSPTDDAWALSDLGSHNGTFVNAVRVESSEVRHGDVIRIGKNVLVLERVNLEAARDLVLAGQSDSVLIGKSVALSAVRADIERVAPTDTPALIIGESGVGKELVANELHRRSGREGPLVPMNAAALPEQLAESELFGHAAGAFTGTKGRGRGLFDEAEGGTLFMDEIGEMPLSLQAKLLRALATGEVRAVGEPKARRANVRIVAATNVDLEAAIDNNTFRGDLYARLAGELIVVPPLRDRREDIPELAQLFLTAAEGPAELDVNAVEALMVHDWRFNVRELEQVMRSSATRAKGAVRLELDHLPPGLRAPFHSRALAAPPSAPEEALPLHLRVRPDAIPSAAELELVLRELEGNVRQVAEFFGRHRAQIYRWAEKLGVDLDSFRE